MININFYDVCSNKGNNGLMGVIHFDFLKHSDTLKEGDREYLDNGKVKKYLKSLEVPSPDNEDFSLENIQYTEADVSNFEIEDDPNIDLKDFVTFKLTGPFDKTLKEYIQSYAYNSGWGNMIRVPLRNEEIAQKVYTWLKNLSEELYPKVSSFLCDWEYDAYRLGFKTVIKPNKYDSLDIGIHVPRHLDISTAKEYLKMWLSEFFKEIERIIPKLVDRTAERFRGKFTGNDISAGRI